MPDYNSMNCAELAEVLNGSPTDDEAAAAFEAFNGKACDVALLSGGGGDGPPPAPGGGHG